MKLCNIYEEVYVWKEGASAQFLLRKSLLIWFHFNIKDISSISWFHFNKNDYEEISSTQFPKSKCQ